MVQARILAQPRITDLRVAMLALEVVTEATTTTKTYYLFILGIHAWKCDYKITLRYLVQLQVVILLTHVMKMLYQQPRPFMQYAGFLPIKKCPMEYGSPSGHSLKSIGFALYAALDLSSPEFGCNKKILILVSFIYSFVVAAKRAFTIAHSFD